MKNIFKLLSVIAFAILTSCIEESGPDEKGMVNEGDGWLMLEFKSSEPVEVETRATHGIVEESQIYNFYLFIFDKDGNKMYGQYFDSNNYRGSLAEIQNGTEDLWYVQNMTDGGSQTNGYVKIKASSGSNLKVYMLTNLDSDMVKISSDLLSHDIKNETDLKNFSVYMNQTTVARNGYFPMTGMLSGVSISGGTLTSPDSILSLKRLDAKVRFIFKTGTREDERGQRVAKFEAKKWKVINVPRTAYLLDYESRGCSEETGHDHGAVETSVQPTEYSEYADLFFDTAYTNFEDFTSSTQSEFSFYMLENRQTPKQLPSDYQERSRQVKRMDAGYKGENQKVNVDYFVNGQPVSREMRIFENANDFSTYVMVTGEVSMELTGDEAGQTLGGEVEYLIHLGDWNSVIDASGIGDANDTYSNVGNYNTLRNTDYTYTVTVNSINNIRVEVESSRGSVYDVVENQPGASGFITIAKEEIALCDCHYVAKTLDFHLINFFEGGKIREDACIVDEMTWMVNTPFVEDGMPEKVGDIYITDGLDYEWVHFRLNKKDGTGNYYSDQRRKFTQRVFASSTTFNDANTNKEDDGTPGLAGYHNDGAMDVVALVKYMQEQVNLWLTNKEVCDFDNKDATDMSLPKISITVFVDEYYYHEHPLTKDSSDPNLWKLFVNQDDRKMHILCNSDISKDLESRATGSVITIQQKSIQSIFNTNPEYTALQTAWGLEIDDEEEHRNWTYGSATGKNTSNNNGLLNTCIEWTLANNASSTSLDSGEKSWSTFMNFEVNNDIPQLRDGYQSLRYSCMTRNRDNNGNGIIDRDEIRWYTGSVSQLMGLYIGEPIISPDAKLYNRTPEEEENESTWYQRVGSSTRYDGSNVYTIWSEEGIATGSSGWSKDSDKPRTVRCLRNLGHIDGNNQETYAIDKLPQDYISMEEDPSEDGSFIFTCTHLNENSLRYYSSKELPLADHRSVENRLYKRFKTAPTTKTYESAVNFVTFNTNIDEAISSNKTNPYCPEGYRTPNQREMAVMKFYNESLITDGYMTRTSWFFGPLGSKPLNTSWTEGVAKNGFTIYQNNVSLQYNQTGNTTRCVRDIRVD